MTARNSFLLNNSLVRYGLSALLLLTLVLGGLSLNRSAYGATYTWDGGGTTNNWSDCDNWTSDICPGSSDTARFDGTSSKDATVDGSFGGTVRGIIVASGYSGTITQARNISVGLDSFTISGGTWRQQTHTFNIDNGNFTLNGGTLTAAGGTNTVERNITFSGGTVTASTTRYFQFDGTSDNTVITCTGGFPTDIIIAKSFVTADITLSSNCNATTTGSVSSQGNLIINGDLHVAGALSMTSSDLNHTVNGTLYVAGNINIDSSGNSTGFTNNGTTTMTGTSFTVEGNFTNNGFISAPSLGAVTFDGNQSTDGTTLTCTGPFFTDIAINKIYAGSNFILSSTCQATTSGALNPSGTVNIQGTLIVDGNISLDGSLITSGTTTVIGTSVAVSTNFTLTGVFDAPSISTINLSTIGGGTDNTTLTCTGDLGYPITFYKNVAQSFVLTAGCEAVLSQNNSTDGATTINGTLGLGGYNFLQPLGSVTISNGATLKAFGTETISGLILADSATVEYNGPSTYTTLAGISDFESLAFSGSGTYTISTDLTVEDDLSNAGSNVSLTGTVTLDGTGQSVTGNFTFGNLTKTVASPDTLTFGAGDTQTITGMMTLDGGGVGNELALVSDSPGTPWLIDTTGNQIGSYLSVTDSTASGDTIYCDPDCIEGTGNTKWVFGPIPEPREVYRLEGGVRLQGGVRF